MVLGIHYPSVRRGAMNRFTSIAGELLKFFLVSLPLALTIYIGLHVGLLFYIIYKKFKSN